jgi:hypothetical protein
MSYFGHVELARGANFEIIAEDGVVRCRVMNPSHVDRDEGARCAREMHETLVGRVLVRRSGFRALIFDVREAPEVFGPKTRSALEELFRAAEGSKMRLAVRISSSAIQRLQFSSLCRECAPQSGKLTLTDADERSWIGE